ncbi:DoxX family protein [Granulicella sibirica]|uniref:DoxX family protein n=1 Tax=Granulicella sibirica TaxID=2479048 RepID=A0A4Q0SWZ4_9BACT|nr:DoxX family membrane protein [Granulicella sibirica]RXH55337.1 hypothetical protein GRAN_4441 [Granulicella sibirica]
MGRYLFGVLFVVAGVMHFVLPKVYASIMPPMLPGPVLLVYVSGVAEILGGVGVMVPTTRKMAAWGLVALLIAVWPANLEMAMHPERFASVPGWALWVRLPLQLPLIWWAWVYTR